MVDWCTINDGVYLLTEQEQAKVLDIVNSAVDVVELSVKIASKMLWLILPGSDRAFLVWDGVAWIPLNGLFTKYWKVEVRIGRNLIYSHALLKQPISDILKTAIEPFDSEAAGSRNWYYRDFDGVIRKGSECTPPRGYRQISDSAKDIGIALLIIGILAALNNAGLYDWSSKLLSKAMTFLRNKKIMTRITNTLDLTEEINTSVLETGTDVNALQTELNKMNKRIGVRLIMH